jgi:hypothetical protein
MMERKKDFLKELDFLDLLNFNKVCNAHKYDQWLWEKFSKKSDITSPINLKQ